MSTDVDQQVNMPTLLSLINNVISTDVDQQVNMPTLLSLVNECNIY